MCYSSLLLALPFISYLIYLNSVTTVHRDFLYSSLRIMDVTRNNFDEVLPVVIEKLQTCQFVSFDLEMSGIFSTDRSNRIRKDDTPPVRYKKMIGPATTYSIVQFGLSIFEDNGDGDYPDECLCTVYVLFVPFNFHYFI